MKPGNKIPPPYEIDEQIQLFTWAKMNEAKYPELKLLNSSLNGVWITSKKQRGQAKAAGMKAGYPDIFLPVSRTAKYKKCEMWRKVQHGLFIELKRRSGGQVTAAQRDWVLALRAQGYRAEVCKGWNEAAEVILHYLKGY